MRLQRYSQTLQGRGFSKPSFPSHPRCCLTIKRVQTELHKGSYPIVTLQRKKRIQIVSGEKADLGDKKDNQIKTYFSRDKYQLESRKCWKYTDMNITAYWIDMFVSANVTLEKHIMGLVQLKKKKRIICVVTPGAEIKRRVKGGRFPFGNGILRIIRLYKVNFSLMW